LITHTLCEIRYRHIDRESKTTYCYSLFLSYCQKSRFFHRICSVTIAIVVSFARSLACIHRILFSPSGKICNEKIRIEIASNCGYSLKEGGWGEGKNLSSNLLLLGYEHIFHACNNYHQETENEKETYAVCSFISLSLILTMMIMFRTVLLFSSVFFSLLSVFSHITQKKKKTGTF
jgi:hypothetical protein